MLACQGVRQAEEPAAVADLGAGLDALFVEPVACPGHAHCIRGWTTLDRGLEESDRGAGQIGTGGLSGDLADGDSGGDPEGPCSQRLMTGHVRSHASISPATTVKSGWAMISRIRRSSRYRPGSRSRSLPFRCATSKSSCPWVTGSDLGCRLRAILEESKEYPRCVASS